MTLRHYTYTALSILLGASLWLFSQGCGNITDQGDASASLASGETATITGTLAPDDSTAKTDGSASCPADTIVAVDSQGSEFAAAIADDCSFNLMLAIGEQYALVLTRDGEFVAGVAFPTSLNPFTTATLPIGDSGVTIALGTITIAGTVGTAGEFEAPVDDDDALAVLPEGQVLAVRPHRMPHCGQLDGDLRQRRCYRVGLSRPVVALISCRVDRSTVTSDTFVVQDEAGTRIACEYDFKQWRTDKHVRRHHHRIIRCKHSSDLFLHNTLYTATLDGVRCEDGRPVETFSWQFLTAQGAPTVPEDSESLDDECEEVEDDEAEDSTE